MLAHHYIIIQGFCLVDTDFLTFWHVLLSFNMQFFFFKRYESSVSFEDRNDLWDWLNALANTRKSSPRPQQSLLYKTQQQSNLNNSGRCNFGFFFSFIYSKFQDTSLCWSEPHCLASASPVYITLLIFNLLLYSIIPSGVKCNWEIQSSILWWRHAYSMHPSKRPFTTTTAVYMKFCHYLLAEQSFPSSLQTTWSVILVHVSWTGTELLNWGTECLINCVINFPDLE